MADSDAHSSTAKDACGKLKYALSVRQQRRFERGTRYYELHLQQDLWGGWEIQRIFGRSKSKHGRVIPPPPPPPPPPLPNLEELKKYSIPQRHYEVV